MQKNCLFSTLLVAVLIPFVVNAQSGDESPIPYFRYSVTGGVGMTQLYSDLDHPQIGPSAYLRGNYFLTHGLSLGLELQEGLLRGKDDSPIDGGTLGPSSMPNRNANNFYHAATLGVRFQPLKFLQEDHQRRIEYRESFAKRTLNSVYIGGSFGVLYSLQWNKQRIRAQSTDPVTGDPIDGVYHVMPEYDGRDHGLSYMISTDIGFEIPLHSLKPNLLDSYIWNLVINAQMNYAFDDELDGYSREVPVNNTKNDSFGFLSLGVNLRF